MHHASSVASQSPFPVRAEVGEDFWSRRISNPLATRYVAPGKIPWIAQETDTIEQLALRFQQLGSRCQIVGAHGTGKSTLLEHLVPRLVNLVVRVQSQHDIDHMLSRASAADDSTSTACWFRLRRNSPEVHWLTSLLLQPAFRGLLVIDGAEQLNWWQWRYLRYHVNHIGCDLLVTAHRNLGLDTLASTKVTPEIAGLALQYASQSAWGSSELPSLFNQLEWKHWLTRHQGNLRECFMDLYDLVEQKLRKANQDDS